MFSTENNARSFQKLYIVFELKVLYLHENKGHYCIDYLIRPALPGPLIITLNTSEIIINQNICIRT